MWFVIVLFFLLNAVSIGQSTSDSRGAGYLINPDSSSFLNDLKGSFIPSDGSFDETKYFLGAGDKLFISIIGLEEIVYTPTLNYEGNIYLPGIGGLSLKGLSLKDAKSRLDSVIKINYKKVASFITLAEIRKIKIYISGSIANPGAVDIYASMRLSELLSRHIKVNSTSDLRNITITSSGSGEKKVYDIVSFLRLGKIDFNPYLREGDFIFIPKFDRYISINGSVQFPGEYEFKEGESVYDIIQLAGGFTSLARADTLELIRYENDDIRQYSVFIPIDSISLKSYKLRNRDRIVIRERALIYPDNIVMIEGYVKYPGYYKIDKELTKLSDIIMEAGGFLPEASLTDAFVQRSSGKEDYDPEFERLKLIPRVDMTEDEYDYYKSKARERKGRLVVDFNSLFTENKKNEDILLRRGDKITIPQKKNYITIIGQVVNPGRIEFKEGLTVEDYINISGGFGWRALSSDVRVVKSNTGEWVDSDEVNELVPGDIIWVPEDPPAPPFWVVFKDTLTILGQVATVVAATVAVAVSVR